MISKPSPCIGYEADRRVPSCSNDLVNRFVACTLLSAKNNHADVPTDCPTRERHGWTGDAQIFADTASYFFEYAPFARKYILDMLTDSAATAKFRQITPAAAWTAI